MQIVDFFEVDNKEHWLSEIKKSEWVAGQYLYELLTTNKMKELTGETTKVLMLTDGENLVSFCAYVEKDDIQPTDLTPWIGFVYTYPQYRGNHYAGKLIEYAEALAKEEGHKRIHISTSHVGLYEKYGYKFWKTLPDVNGKDSRVYVKELYKYILFDLDGTLTDPGIGITNSVMYALEKFGIKVNDRATLYKFIGPPLLESFQQYYGFSKEESEQGLKYYREYFKPKGLYENEVYQGIENLLFELKKSQKKLLVATSKPEEFAVEILKHFHLYEYFDYVAGASMDEKRVKKADVIAYALESYGITDKSSAVMIGDREHDVLGAKENHLKSIGVLYGYGDHKELVSAGADYIAEKPEDILQIILEKENK